jgi:hypothetical protein
VVHKGHAWAESCLCGHSLLKFRDGPGEDTYNEYRDAAGKMLMAKGGYMAFIGNMKASLLSTWSHARADADICSDMRQ